ncbi:MAG: spore maturation protein A, partial [Clostridia bacterium]|nr:spore maturation protein A [Clostridia bacterium]
SMGGALCLWSGLLEVLERTGVTRRLARLSLPLLRHLIRPKAPSPETQSALSENFAANLLGLGNAATPAGLRAVSLLQEEGDRDAVSRLVLLNSCSVQLIPFTAASLRSASGAQSPFAILPVVWIASLVSLTVSFWVYRRLTHA